VETCRGMYEWLGAQGLSMPGEDAINNFIDPNLYRATAEKAPALPLSSAQIALTEILQGRRVQEKEMEVSPRSREIIKAGLPMQSSDVKNGA